MRTPTTRHLPIAASAVHAVPAPPVERPISDGEKLLRVGDLEKRTGKSIRALHLYEELGLLVPRDRSKGNYRLYDENAVTRIQWIESLHALGLSLTQIKDMLDAWRSAPSAPAAMAKVRADYAAKLGSVRQEIAKLVKLETELVASLAYLDDCNSCSSLEATHACARCDHHEHTEPDLVAGIHGGRVSCEGHAGVPVPPAPESAPIAAPARRAKGRSS
jgi:MerR family copper efflux transcriptional regulator